ncbi:MAG: hypothetical protein LW847_04940, partial [Burkholderiales bacterium]|nr:hypothetical protein [Burkholderiales bacterium]
MGNTRNRHPARQRFLKQSAALTAQATLLTAPVAVVAKVAGSDRTGETLEVAGDPASAAGSRPHPSPPPLRRGGGILPPPR